MNRSLSVIRVFETESSVILREALARLVVDVMRLADDAASGGFGLSVV